MATAGPALPAKKPSQILASPPGAGGLLLHELCLQSPWACTAAIAQEPLSLVMLVLKHPASCNSHRFSTSHAMLCQTTPVFITMVFPSTGKGLAAEPHSWFPGEAYPPWAGSDCRQLPLYTRVHLQPPRPGVVASGGSEKKLPFPRGCGLSVPEHGLTGGVGARPSWAVWDGRVGRRQRTWELPHQCGLRDALWD